MTVKKTLASRPAAPRAKAAPLTDGISHAPWTMEERLESIEAMAKRITGYVQFMSKIGKLPGTSAESKEAAVLAFYERMVVFDRQLGRIQEELQLG
jgi:hypothetical protein